MFVLNCLATEHDLKYLAAAVLACTFGTALFVGMLSRVRSSAGSLKVSWVLLSGMVGGGVTWTTHYTAMIGFSPTIDHLYLPFTALAALLSSIVTTTIGAAVFSVEKGRGLPEAGGILIGLGMSLTHGIAMRSFLVEATIEWHTPTIILSIFLGALMGGIGANRLSKPATKYFLPASCLAFAMSLLLMHFSSIAGMTLVPNQGVTLPVVVISDQIVMMGILTVITLLLVLGWTFFIIDAKSNEAAGKRFKFLEHHDALTGLSNRTGLTKALEAMIAERCRQGERLAVMYFDLRRFGNINDVHGHAAGDDVLKTVASRLTVRCGAESFLARAGGDEFVAVLPAFSSTSDVSDFASRIMQVVSKPVVWRGKQLEVSANVGVSIYPYDGATADTLISHSHLALRRARKDTDNDVIFYDLKRDEANRTKSAIAIDLRYAVQRGEFELYYQQQNSAVTRELIGFEVLLRWNHPERGIVQPGDFIPIAEAYGYIPEIGEWVLRQACMEAAKWATPFKIAVNVAPDQLCKPNLPEIVRDALEASGLPASRLELEVTETGIIADHKRALDIITRLKEMGVGLAMDDYGTGSSSLSTLKNYPFDKIKIDKSFVTSIASNPQSAAIVKSTVILGKSLRIPILAEGVETECALKYLKKLGCAEVQGFLFGKPMPAHLITQLKPL